MAAAKGTTTKDAQSRATTGATSENSAVEQQVVAFAEQLGRIVGTVQAKTEGWLDGEALKEQLSHVRDSASALLDQLGVQKPKTAPTAETRTPAKAAAPAKTAAPAKSAETRTPPKSASASSGRSGGMVDAPGKKHRKPVPNASVRNTPARANAADAGRIAKMKAANAGQRRGRG